MEKKLSQKYAFTLTLKPKLYITRPNSQLKETIPLIMEYLLPHKVSIVYELTKAMNIHYHGIIEFDLDHIRHQDPEYHWYNMWRRQTTVGFTDLRVMTDEEGWKRYITKDIPRTRVILQGTFISNPVKDNHNLSDYDQLPRVEE